MNTLEQEFMQRLMVALSRRPNIKVHRQNTGMVLKKHGGVFHAGPPPGAADISGIVGPEGWRLEVETKGQETKNQDNQKLWGEMIRKHGGIYAKVRYEEKLSMEQNIEAAVAMVMTEILRKRLSCKPARGEKIDARMEELFPRKEK